MSDTPVLIVGAGPTGLVLALCLNKRGVPFRLIDDGVGPGEFSRAIVAHARTLEFYRQLGIADAVIDAGIPLAAIEFREGHRRVATASFSDLGGDVSPYPFALCYPQDDHERFLSDRLAAVGTPVEWGTRLLDLEMEDDGGRATLVHAGGREESVDAAYVCGSDGARSAVRRALGIGFPGGTYDQLFYVADTRIAGPFRKDVVVNLGERILALMLPVRSSGMHRLIGLVPPELSGRDDLSFEDLRAEVEALIDVTVEAVNWFATYRSHHRVAERFRSGRAFLLGDAGHIHSPAGGQGMNTGIGDAVNLAWKLADVIAGRAGDALLDSYEAERIPFARQLVATTDRAFQGLVTPGLAGAAVRRFAVPLLAGTLTRSAWGRRLIFRTISQTAIRYRESPLSEGRAGPVRGGDRLPWTGAKGADNFAPLASLDWQVHVYGAAAEPFRAAAARRDLPLHAFPFDAGARARGLPENAALLVRPDGYVALALETQDGAALDRYLDARALRLGL